MRIHYPLAENAYIDLPDVWLGRHARRHDEAVEKSRNLGSTLLTFAASMALLEDWSLPGLPGNPENWNFEELDLRVIAWVNQQVMTRYNMQFIIPKNSLAPSPAGSMATPTGNQDGDLQTTA